MILGNPAEPYRNAAGYSDPTAYLAEKNMRKDTNRMIITSKMVEIGDGEVWRAESKRGDQQMYLTIKALSGLVVVLEVCAREPCEYAAGVLVGSAMYWVSTARPFMAKKNLFTRLVRKLSPDEFAEIKKGMVSALGLEVVAKEPAPIVESPMDELKRKLAEQERELKIMRMEAELQMYKDFVEKLGGVK